ncbi:basic blue protein-like [Lycium barbarum]|uniref:basic blue protein-like n=1 Tax=Lycium barbarum TaxID=112863 RepID=UPI00293EB8FA|nr:basic blue protein-like [Lycium barbarum]
MLGKQVFAIFPVIIMVLFSIQITITTHSYVVGDSVGWTFGVSSWANERKFDAGDLLLFKYHKGVHNVMIVNKANYDNCNAIGKTLSSGNDSVTLGKVPNYFICGIDGHCNDGLKMEAIAH